MKMEVLAIPSMYESVLGSNKIRDWTSTLTPLAVDVHATATGPNKVAANDNSRSMINNNNINNNNNNNNNTNNRNHSIKRNSKQEPSSISKKTQEPSAASYTNSIGNSRFKAYTYTPYGDDDELGNVTDIDATAVNELSMRLLDELRAAKSRHLTCTEVSIPCDLTPNIAAEIIRVSEKEPCGIRGATIYIEFEDEPQNSRRIASLKLDPETVSTFEVYLTLRQDHHRGWTALLPQFMKSLARTITISPEYTITKHKLYSADGLGARRSYSFGSSSQAIATPTT
ncbi:protein scylla [Scaptodrosophila lebanonensis]|uniref:Protein scylla n=1 Tax=Drosophila lebanonensis TaxID=7225 RepID=A0A6J2T9L1_DROLE|nr:protein scylla [Scaptodrosophila lebanonensis]